MAYLRTALTAFLVLVVAPTVAHADLKGEWTQTDALGMNLYQYNFTAGSEDTDVTQQQNLSEFIGLHYYFADHWRVGMALQFTERLNPSITNGTSDLRTFGFLPQIGWNFARPFFMQLTLGLLPWTSGVSELATSKGASSKSTFSTCSA